jgi:predicted N-acetyltransferase YhbS
MEIRQENQSDYETVYKIIKEAFATAEQSDGNEQDLVVALRNSRAFIPELSLVAVEDKNVIGHILFTKAKVGKNTVLALAPLSVHPVHQRKGAGLALMKKGHTIAKKLGYDYSVVLGNSKYYSKAGYIPASIYGIKAPFDVPDENFMAIRLNSGAEKLEGIVKYDKAFGIN